MRSLFIYSLSCVIFSLSGWTCDYSFSDKDFKVEWTAYKTAAKTPVKGSFSEVRITSKPDRAPVKTLLSHARVEINGLTVASGDEARDTNLKMFFFQLMKQTKIEGRVKKVDEGKKELTLNLRMNKVKKDVTMKYTLAPEGTFEASGVIDVLDFSMRKSFDSLHNACKELHQGKSWSEVGISIKGSFKKSC